MGLPCSSSQNNSCYNKSFWQDFLFGYIKRQGCTVSETGRPQGWFFHKLPNAYVSVRPFPWNRRHTALRDKHPSWESLHKAEGASLGAWRPRLWPSSATTPSLMCLLCSPEQHPGKLDGWVFPSVSGSKNSSGDFVLAFCPASVPFLCLNLVPIALSAVLVWSGLKESSKKEEFSSPTYHTVKTITPCWHILKHPGSTLCWLEIVDSVVQSSAESL